MVKIRISEFSAKNNVCPSVIAGNPCWCKSRPWLSEERAKEDRWRWPEDPGGPGGKGGLANGWPGHEEWRWQRLARRMTWPCRLEVTRVTEDQNSCFVTYMQLLWPMFKTQNKKTKNIKYKLKTYLATTRDERKKVKNKIKYGLKM